MGNSEFDDEHFPEEHEAPPSPLTGQLPDPHTPQQAGFSQSGSTAGKSVTQHFRASNGLHSGRGQYHNKNAGLSATDYGVHGCRFARLTTAAIASILRPPDSSGAGIA